MSLLYLTTPHHDASPSVSFRTAFVGGRDAGTVIVLHLGPVAINTRVWLPSPSYVCMCVCMLVLLSSHVPVPCVYSTLCCVSPSVALQPPRSGEVGWCLLPLYKEAVSHPCLCLCLSRRGPVGILGADGSVRVPRLRLSWHPHR